MKIDSYLSLCKKVKSKWTKDLNQIPKAVKLLEENFGEMLQYIGLDKDLLNKTSQKNK